VYVPDNELGRTYVINGSTGDLIETVLSGDYPPIALDASGGSIAALGFPDETTAIVFYNTQNFGELGNPVNFPQRQDPLSIVAGSNGRYYVTFFKNNSIGIVSGPQ
jgi:DNA-binding beta-propeller fold protein YncE